MGWNNHIVRADAPHLAICFMAHSGTNDNREHEANACLIAAAPELLDALLRAKWVIDELGYPVDVSITTAIAKATGGTR